MNFEKSVENWLREQSYEGHGGWICCHPLTFLHTQLPSWHGHENQQSCYIQTRPIYLVGERILLLVSFGDTYIKNSLVNVGE